jgi:hypothetical protein
MQKYVKIGELKVTVQSFVIACASMVLALLTLVCTPTSFGTRFVSFVAILIGGFVSAYNVHCAVNGRCDIWAWVLAVIFVINVTSAAAAFALGASGKKLRI